MSNGHDNGWLLREDPDAPGIWVLQMYFKHERNYPPFSAASDERRYTGVEAGVKAYFKMAENPEFISEHGLIVSPRKHRSDFVRTRMNEGQQPGTPIAYSTVFQMIEEAESLEEAVYLAVGAASVCWEKSDLAQSGIFQDDQACRVADSLIKYVRG